MMGAGGMTTVDVRVTDTGDVLAGVEMFAGLEPEARQRVMAAAVPRTYRKGQPCSCTGQHQPASARCSR